LRPDRLPADEPAGALPVEWPDGRAPPVQTARDTLTASASGRAPPAVELVVAGVRGQPALVVSGFSDSPLTLYRRGNDQMPPQALASFTADLDGSLYDAAGQFLGRLHGDAALFHPDWLRRIGASSTGSENSANESTATSVGENSGTSGSSSKPEELPRTLSRSSVVPVEWTTDFDYACKAMGLDRRRASKILHQLKKFLGGDDNVLIHIPSGDVYYGDECIGNLRD